MAVFNLEEEKNVQNTSFYVIYFLFKYIFYFCLFNLKTYFRNHTTETHFFFSFFLQIHKISGITQNSVQKQFFFEKTQTKTQFFLSRKETHFFVVVKTRFEE